ncbi:sugar phosphate isomerase/epimerase [Treponema sp. OttesenSCG-928-L16]|nr:sugar phosphate isomerase/epimerase [Treponema sp. OttesenSCG-928-L16]
MIRSGIVSATFRNKSPEDIIRLASAAGLEGVEWSENSHVFPGDPEGAEKLGAMTSAAGLSAAAYGSYYRLGTEEDAVRAFAGRLVSAAALGAPVIRVWAGVRASADVSPDEFSKLAEEASVIASMAAQDGIKVAFEWHKNTLTDTNESAMRLLESADNPNLYCLWQPTAALSEAERCEGLRLLGKRLLNLHVYHWPGAVRRPLAEGESSWAAYFSCMDREEDRYALLEFVMGDSEEQFIADAETLKRWLKGELDG